MKEEQEDEGGAGGPASIISLMFNCPRRTGAHWFRSYEDCFPRFVWEPRFFGASGHQPQELEWDQGSDVPHSDDVMLEQSCKKMRVRPHLGYLNAKKRALYKVFWFRDR